MTSEEILGRIKHQATGIGKFEPDERDLLARIARARQPSKAWGIAAAAAGAAATLVLALAIPGPSLVSSEADLESQIVESFGSGLTGESLGSWDDWTASVEDVPSPLFSSLG